MSHAPASALHLAMKREKRAYGVDPQVPGMNCIKPPEPEPPLLVTQARSPDSQRAIVS